MQSNFPNGVWPVMLTPFTKDNQVDYNGLKEIVEWYIKNNVAGIFSVCQSSEMFILSLDERVKIAECVKKSAAGRVPVVASGHISDDFKDQIEEINAIAKTGVDAIILITNRLAKKDESEDIWISNLNRLLENIETDIPLGFYECPHPYKRLMTPKMVELCIKSERFYFLKDTSCNLEEIKSKLDIMSGSRMKLFNANASTLYESLKYGASGYSGIMANMQANLYSWLCNNYKNENALKIADFLTMSAFMEGQCYPVCAKYFLGKLEGLNITTKCRVKSELDLNQTQKNDVVALGRLNEYIKKEIARDA